MTAKLERQGFDARALPLKSSSDPAGPFDTVVLVRAIEFEEAQETRELLLGAWDRVGLRGELLVCVPHEDHVDEPGVRQRFTRKGLKKLLKAIDWPRIFTDQPFGWLLMSVKSGARVNRTTEQRYRVIAGLCRGRVLELGCGSGELCDKISQRGHAVVGVDKSAAKIAKAHRLYPAIEFEQADILELAGRPEYDTVVLAEVLEHVPDDVGESMLRKAWDLVATGGRLVVSVPNEGCVRHANHLREFTLADFLEMLRPLGRPKLVADQPFKWLLAWIERPAGSGSR